MASQCEGKSSWPELVGTNGDYAAEVIKSQNPNIDDAVVILDGSPVTTDFRCDRVWIRVDKYRIVVRVPSIG